MKQQIKLIDRFPVILIIGGLIACNIYFWAILPNLIIWNHLPPSDKSIFLKYITKK